MEDGARVMKILFDQGTPVPIRRHLHPHEVDTAFERGWGHLSNGDLIRSAETDGYELLITTDQNLKYQQNLSKRTISILVLKTTSWPRIQTRILELTDAIARTQPGSYHELFIP